jgi:hypothetical protein
VFQPLNNCPVLGDRPSPLNCSLLFVIPSKADLSRRAVEGSAVSLSLTIEAKEENRRSLHAGAGGMTKGEMAVYLQIWGTRKAHSRFLAALGMTKRKASL